MRESRGEGTYKSVAKREHVFRSRERNVAGFSLAVVLLCVRCKQALLYLLDNLRQRKGKRVSLQVAREQYADRGSKGGPTDLGHGCAIRSLPQCCCVEPRWSRRCSGRDDSFPHQAAERFRVVKAVVVSSLWRQEISQRRHSGVVFLEQLVRVRTRTNGFGSGWRIVWLVHDVDRRGGCPGSLRCESRVRACVRRLMQMSARASDQHLEL